MSYLGILNRFVKIISCTEHSYDIYGICWFANTLLLNFFILLSLLYPDSILGITRASFFSQIHDCQKSRCE